MKLSDKIFADSVTYDLSGNEQAVTRLHLSFDGWKDGEDQDAQLAFDIRALTLLSKVLCDGRANDVLARVKSELLGALQVDGLEVSYKIQEWGEGRVGRYCRELTIRHSRDVDDN